MSQSPHLTEQDPVDRSCWWLVRGWVGKFTGWSMLCGKTQELSIAVCPLHLGIPRSCCELLGSAILAAWGLGVELCLSGGIITTHGNPDVGQFCTGDLEWFFVRYRLCGHLNFFFVVSFYHKGSLA